MTQPFGATPDEWEFWQRAAPGDLLPVVSNPHATISDKSKMVGLGKTPSHYNRNGDVIGMPGWTGKVSTAEEVAEWSLVADYGICLQTRSYRAIDIDVPDPAKADAIETLITKTLGIELPVRTRSNSGKRLMLFRLEGDYSKRTLKVDGGVIEMLMTGQQCIVAGTHQEGARYEWSKLQHQSGSQSENGLEAAPVLTTVLFDDLLLTLDIAFGIEGWNTARLTADRSNLPKTGQVHDEVSAYLRDSVWFRGDDKDGRVYITCPWSGGHSSDSGETETTYFPGGSNGFDQGAFKCLHASCSGRSDSDFKFATGWSTDGFVPVGEVERMGGVPVAGPVGVDATAGSLFVEDHYPIGIAVDTARLRGDMPTLDRRRNGTIKATVENVLKVLCCEDLMGFRLARDRFRDEIVIGDHAAGWAPFTDADYTTIRVLLGRRGFEPVSQQMVRDALLRIIKDNSFDSAQRWVSRLIWDGEKRVKHFMHRYMGAEDTPYATAMSEYIWTGMAGRVMSPGCQCDTVPVWVSPQGTKKSSAVAAMAPHREYFVEIDMQEKDTDLARRLRGRVIGELSELRGLHSREMEAVKAWVTRRFEDFIPKYQEFATQFPRRCLFIGTTNREEFLADETGNRRWAPIVVTGGDVNKIDADREQLWAEALVMWRDGGIKWQELDRLAGGEHAQFMMHDDWSDIVLKWINTTDALTGVAPASCEFLQLSEIARGALHISGGVLKRADSHRLAAVMIALNYKRGYVLLNGVKTKIWTKTEPPAPP